ncbi:hypothetical protein ACJX0J_016873, partial [Zea mays]
YFLVSKFSFAHILVHDRITITHEDLISLQMNLLLGEYPAIFSCLVLLYLIGSSNGLSPQNLPNQTFKYIGLRLYPAPINRETIFVVSLVFQGEHVLYYSSEWFAILKSRLVVYT